MTLHDDELTLDDDLVRALVDDLLPEARTLPLVRLASSGSTNALWRLGDDLLVRLPRQPGGEAGVVAEQRWTPYVAPHLPVAVPEVVAVGEPSAAHPEPWSVVRWLDGDVPAVGDPSAERTGLARDLAAVVAALRQAPVPDEAAADAALRWYRGGPLALVAETVEAAIDGCRALPDLDLDLDLDAARAAWDAALALPGATRTHPPRWMHADLVAENLLVGPGRPERLTAVLDLGCLTVGDPAVDLGVAWELLGPADREVFREGSGATEEDWLLGRGWALAIALNALPYYWRTMPERCRARLVAARAVLADPG